MDKKIVSTFMYSDFHEQELLWLKFNVEDNFVNEWVITESKFTFQGKRKNMFLKEVLDQPRFKKFINKIHIIEIDINYNFYYEPTFFDLLKRKIKRLLIHNFNKNYELVPYAELASFFSEINQRGASLDYLNSKYSKEDIVIICDTDEIFDFNGNKMNLLNNVLLKYNTPFYLKREIYCYDFNNFSNRIRYSPIVKLKDLVSKHDFQNIRNPLFGNRKIIELNQNLVFEYTFCFQKDAIVKKLTSFAHVTDLDAESIDFCLDNNITLINPERIDENYIQNKESFFEMIDISKENAPLFLYHNIEHFRTNIVNKDYKENRKKTHEFNN